MLSLSLRLVNIGDHGFNSDEAIYSGQAGSLAGLEEFNQHFSLFRAHPLLLQFFISIAFTLFGVSDVIAQDYSSNFWSCYHFSNLFCSKKSF